MTMRIQRVKTCGWDQSCHQKQIHSFIHSVITEQTKINEVSAQEVRRESKNELKVNNKNSMCDMIPFMK